MNNYDNTVKTINLQHGNHSGITAKQWRDFPKVAQHDPHHRLHLRRRCALHCIGCTTVERDYSRLKVDNEHPHAHHTRATTANANASRT